MKQYWNTQYVVGRFQLKYSLYIFGRKVSTFEQAVIVKKRQLVFVSLFAIIETWVSLGYH